MSTDFSEMVNIKKNNNKKLNSYISGLKISMKKHFEVLSCLLL